jgi:RNA polymerase sigma factor (sigma-70 family)
MPSSLPIRASQPFLPDFIRLFDIQRNLHQRGPSNDYDCTLHLRCDCIDGQLLREPSRLPAFANTIVKRHIITRIRERCFRRKSQSEMDEVEVFAASREPDPEHRTIRNRANQRLAQVLKLMSPRDRDILYRFYVLEQDADEVCRELRITATEFRNAKHRAKDRLVRKWHQSDGPGIRRLPGRVCSDDAELAA